TKGWMVFLPNSTGFLFRRSRRWINWVVRSVSDRGVRVAPRVSRSGHGSIRRLSRIRVRSPWLTRWSALALLGLTTSCTEQVEIEPPEPSAQGPGPVHQDAQAGPSVPVVFEDPGLPVRTRDGLLRGRAVSPDRRFSRDFYRSILRKQLALYPH